MSNRRSSHSASNGPTLPPRQCPDCPADDQRQVQPPNTLCTRCQLVAQEKAIRAREANKAE